tara:strand:+ start:318 stop:545 length:228 start_codon:yes stop_codon:yes gene_type:complete
MSEEKIKSIIESITKKNLTQDENLLDDGVLDSLMTLALIEELEESFAVLIPTNEFTHFNFNSIDSISEMLKRIGF